MKKFKRGICLMMTLLLAVSVFGGCKKEKTASSDEKVQLKWVFGGPGKLEDSERVWGEFNKKLQDYLPGTEVEFVCIPHADYAEKWRLMAASQEKVDIAWVSYALNFVEETAKGSYMDITNLVQEYGQDMLAEFPDWLLELTTIDGKIYAIPNYQMMTNPVGYSVDKQHVEKGWIDVEEAEKVLCLERPWKKEDFKVFEDYLTTVLNSGEKVKYVSKQFMNRVMKNIGLPAEGLEPIICNAAVIMGDESCTVYDTITDFPENYDYYELAYDWYKKGLIRKDILENPTEDQKDYLLWWTSTLDGAETRLLAQYGKPMEVLDARAKLYIGHKSSTTNTALAANCEYPERSMQLLNLMNSSKGAELLNLMSFGIEGEHYKKVSDNRIEWLGEATVGSANNKYGYSLWTLGNTIAGYETQNEPEGWNEYLDKDVNKNAEMSKLAGFTLDQSPIKLEISQYNAVMTEYSYLDSGTIKNYEEVIKERNAKLKEAGSEKIVKEVQRQVNEWLKSKNK